ncbi:PAS domain-containing sensor histidine kinase [Pontibacter sp. MBLB2868]|uniref:PAS domain-containing sensor histidine kinase n=1 Tax=Pontibacter sp. MBLB2868 TaxID=3451555 RepID=UPI003F753C1A
MSLESDTVSSFSPDEKLHDKSDVLLNSIIDYAIYLVDPAGYVTTWNTGASQLTEFEASEIIGNHFSKLFTSQDRENEYPSKMLTEAKARGRFEDEGWREKKGGIVYWSNDIVRPVYNQDGRLTGYSIVSRDISEKNKARDDFYRAFQELKQSEEKFRMLVEGVSDYAIFMLDPAGNVVTWNEGARKMKGYEAKEIVGKHFSKFYSKESIENRFPDYELKQASEKGIFEDNGWRYRKDGSAFWANTLITAIYNDQHELIGFSKITRDLTERLIMEQQLYRMNEELKDSEEKIRLLVDSVKDYAILMLTPEGNIMSWNEGAKRIKGYTADEIIGKNISTFYTREAIEEGFPQYEMKKAQELGHFEDEGWRIRKDGTAFWANVIITPIYNSENRLLGFAKITRDLTERRRNEELMLKNNELLKINNELDSFVYAASHDLKAPIINLEGLLDALKEDLGDDIQKYETLLQLMGGSVSALKNVITDLSDITKLDFVKANVESINIPALLEEIKVDLDGLINRSNADVKIGSLDFEEIKYSRKNLRSIIFNLLSNAIKYAAPHRVPEVSINTIISENGQYVLSVTDNGLGIHQSHTNKIFSLFKRAHDHVEGSGVGLYLIKRILDNSGDSILVDSKVGEGSTFSVYFNQQVNKAGA